MQLRIGPSKRRVFAAFGGADPTRALSGPVTPPTRTGRAAAPDERPVRVGGLSESVAPDADRPPQHRVTEWQVLLVLLLLLLLLLLLVLLLSLLLLPPLQLLLCCFCAADAADAAAAVVVAAAAAAAAY